MAHELEHSKSMAYAREGGTPWHGLGVAVDSDLTPEEMMKAASLDWTVSRRPIYTTQEPMAFGAHTADDATLLCADDGFMLLRDSDNARLGYCGKKYVPIQNADAFQFFDKFVKAGNMTMETAGSLRGGKLIWALAKMDKAFKLPGNDEVTGNILLTHPHIYGQSLTIQFTPIRVVCMNTLMMALHQAGDSGYRMPHIAEFDDTAMKAAEEALGLSDARLKEFEEKAEFLASKSYTDKTLKSYLTELLDKPNFDGFIKKALQTSNDNDKMTDIVANLEFELQQVRPMVGRAYQAVMTSPGHDLKSANGTWWGALNGMTYLYDHQLGRQKDPTLHSNWFGPNKRVKQKALDKAIEYAEAA